MVYSFDHVHLPRFSDSIYLQCLLRCIVDCIATKAGSGEMISRVREGV